MKNRLHRSSLLLALSLCGSSAVAHAQSVPEWCEGPRNPDRPQQQPDAYPNVTLAKASGDLCPEGTFNLRSAEGAVTILSSTTKNGSSSCLVEMDVEVPAGWRFRQPVFAASVQANSATPQPASQVQFKLELVGHGAHTIPATIVPVLHESTAPEDVLVCSVANLTLQECPDPTQPTKLRLNLTVTAVVQKDTFLNIGAFDFNFYEQAQWVRCDEGF